MIDDNDKASKIHRRKRENLIRILVMSAILCMSASLLRMAYYASSSSTGSTTARRAAAAVRKNSIVETVDEPPRSVQLARLAKSYAEIEGEVRAIKATGVIMERDGASLEATGRLKVAAAELCRLKYGPIEPYHIRVDLTFQNGEKDFIILETAPLDLIPYAVYNFMEMARGYKGGGFHRKANHVLQVAVQSSVIKKSLAFQEYSDEFPHAKGTVGYCGRPSGVCWYISIMDNSKNHGPGSQQKENPYEADANFGRVIRGFDTVVPRIFDSMPRQGFLNDRKDWVLITGMQIMVQDSNGEYVEWHDDEAGTV